MGTGLGYVVDERVVGSQNELLLRRVLVRQRNITRETANINSHGEGSWQFKRVRMMGDRRSDRMGDRIRYEAEQRIVSKVKSLIIRLVDIPRRVAICYIHAACH